MKKIEENDNIVKLIHVFTDTREAILVLEFCGGGELLDVLEKQENERFTEECVARYAYQLLNARATTRIHSTLVRRGRGRKNLDAKLCSVFYASNASKASKFGLKFL